jgi:ubiquinone/menaquinone biosynthesis C-methylase UbiE
MTAPSTFSGHICPHQLSFFLDNRFRRWLQPPRKIIAPYLQKGATAVDVGCGPGFFTIDMAKLVGPQGKVVAVDLQPRMLSLVRQKALRHNVADRIVFHQCHPERIDLQVKADFVLAYYMIHETPNPKRFIEELKEMLAGKGQLLIVEPKMHVSRTAFEEMVSMAGQIGFRLLDFPKGKGGRSMLLGL